MNDTLPVRMIALMSDGCWHPASELVEKISHRFSATKHVLTKRGYHFATRKGSTEWEYRMTVKQPV